MTNFKTNILGILPNNFHRKLRSFRDQYLRHYRYESLPVQLKQQQKYHSISFCITCMNRLFHLRHTIEKNILDNIDYPNIEFVLINYNSQDNLDDFVKKNLSKYIDKGILNYYRTNEPSRFHASIAKNLAHRLAKGHILCNLDGDNFTGKNFAYYINYLYNQHGDKYIYHFHKPPFWGTNGRICMTKENFMTLGGYDESFLPIGHEDMDLIDRGKAKGLDLKVVEIENFLRYLSNTTFEKSVNCTDEYENYYNLENKNRLTSIDNIKKGKLIANTSGFKKFILYKNFHNQAISSESIN